MLGTSGYSCIRNVLKGINMVSGNTPGAPKHADVRKTFLLVMGFGCLLAWNYVAFFSRLVHYSTRNDISHLNSTYTFACCGMIVMLMAWALPWGRWLDCCAWWKSARERRRRSPRSVLLTASMAAALVVTACTVTLIFVEHEYFKQPWCSIASTVAGAGVGVLFLSWAPLFSYGTSSRSSVYLAMAFMASAVLFLAITSAPEVLALLLTCLLPLASLAMLWRLYALRDGEAMVRERPLPSSARPAFVRLLISVGLLGFSESMMRALFLVVDPASDFPAYQWLFLVGTVVAVAIVMLASLYRKNPARALNRSSLFTLVFLSLLAPIVFETGPLGDVPVLVCYCLFYLFLWATLSQMAQAYAMPTRIVFGLGLGVAYAGCLIGTFVGSLLTSFATLDHRLYSLLALLCASLTLVSLLFVADDRMLTTLMNTDSERPQAPRRFALRIKEAAQAHGLTAKETEVLGLAAKGRTTQRICEELGISTGTANTHLMHIYKKFDVHDRQQLLDMLEAQ